LLILRGCNGEAAGRHCTYAHSSSTFGSRQTGGNTHIADAQLAAATAAGAAAAGVTTPVGAPKPDAWLEVVDKKSGLTYYWNQDSGVIRLRALDNS
jgi:hypothetical protein